MKSILLISEYFHPEEFGINDLIFKLKSKNYNIYVLTQTPSYPYNTPFYATNKIRNDVPNYDTYAQFSVGLG